WPCRTGVRLYDRMDRLLLRVAQLHADLHAEVPEALGFSGAVGQYRWSRCTAHLHSTDGLDLRLVGTKTPVARVLPRIRCSALSGIYSNYMLSGIGFGELVAVQILFAVLISMFSGPGPAAIAEIFPTRSRSTWMTSGYALAVAIFGGFAPFISVWLIDRF